MTTQTSVEDKLLALKQKYLASLPEKLSDIQAHWQNCKHQSRIDDKALESALHKLAGSAGMYEQDEMGQLARDAELVVADCGTSLTEDTIKAVDTALDKLRQKIHALTDAAN